MLPGWRLLTTEQSEEEEEDMDNRSKRLSDGHNYEAERVHLSS
jgi:hypothetical protein